MEHLISLDINNNKLTIRSKFTYLKVLHNVCRCKKKNITFEQYARIYYDGTKIAKCATVSDTVFVLHSAFTSKDNYFQAAIQEATDVFNIKMLDFGYHQNLELYDLQTHQVHLPQKIRFTNSSNKPSFRNSLHCTTSKSSSSLMNVVPLKSHCSSANLHTKMQTLSLPCRTLFDGHHHPSSSTSHHFHPLIFFAGLHCFNWSSTLHHSTSHGVFTASTGLFVT